MPRLLDKVLAPLGYEPAAKAAYGPGVAFFNNDVPMSIFNKSDQDKMGQAIEVGRQDRWIRAAERAISTAFGTVPWHLEDQNGEEVTDDSPAQYVAVRDLLEKPYRPMPGDPINATPRTRSGLWGVTSRHDGLAGNAFWYLDETSIGTGLPSSLLYVNPSRMTPAGTMRRLVGWVLDADNRGGGTPLEAGRVLHFTLEEPDDGFLAAGLVETALSSVQIGKYGDRHLASQFASGGKLPGVFSPKAEAGIMPPDVFQALEKELRAAKDDPDATRRNMILRGPIDFTPTSATPEQMDAVAIMGMARDDKLDLWGVPLSQLGGSSPAGLNSGGKGGYEEAVFWQKAVGPRLTRFWEVIQFQFLDPLGFGLQLVIDEPTFDDDMPKYDMAVKAQNLPLRNVERRALIGLEPLGDEALDNAIWMPSGIVPITTEPIEWSKVPSKEDADTLVTLVESGLLTHDEGRQFMDKPPIVWSTDLSDQEKADLIEQVKAGVVTHDEARALMGLPPMQYDETPEGAELIAQVTAGILTHDEARAELGRPPLQWAEGPSPDEVGALTAQIKEGLLTADEARAQLGRPAIQWPEDLNEKVTQAGELIRAGFDPDDVLRTLGLPQIRHLGLPPVTVQKVNDAAGVPGAPEPAKARIAELRTSAARLTPQIERAVAAFLVEQKRELAKRVSSKADHLARKPGDISVWWDAEEWDKRLAEVLRPFAKQIATMTTEHTAATLGKR